MEKDAQGWEESPREMNHQSPSKPVLIPSRTGGGRERKIPTKSEYLTAFYLSEDSASSNCPGTTRLISSCR